MSGVISEVVEAVETASENSKGQMESHLRSILKAFSWRIVATLTTAVIAFFVTGDITTAITIGGIEFILKMAIYYFHERLWLLF
jgi:uncharacterized membrane protein